MVCLLKAFLVGFVFLLGTTTGHTTEEVVRGAGEYLLRSVDANNGAISMTPDLLWINPYFAGFAAVGLARVSQFTGNSTFVAAAWRHLAWHQAHMNTTWPHYITDYERTSKSHPWESTRDFDSTDSYAALFILALGEAFRVDPDLAKLQSLQTGLVNSVAAINSTLSNGLTWAKPSYHMKYTMDNSEVFAGLSECAFVADALGLLQLRETCRNTAQLVADTAAIELLSSRGDYFVAAGEHLANWTRKYPDALAQVFPPAFGLLDPKSDHAANLTAAFVTMHPEWCHPLDADPDDPGDTVGWGFVCVGLALRAVGRTTDAESAAKSMWDAALSANLAYPFHSSSCGSIVSMLVDKQRPRVQSSHSDDGDDDDNDAAALTLAIIVLIFPLILHAFVVTQ